MRLVLALLAVAIATAGASAQCPPSCSGGGGPAATDCCLAYGGLTGKVLTCTEGDPSCDVDGKIDGTCTFALSACTNVAVGACAATPLDSPPTVVPKGTGAEAFVSAVGGLSTTTQQCTDPGLVKLSIVN